MNAVLIGVIFSLATVACYLIVARGQQSTEINDRIDNVNQQFDLIIGSHHALKSEVQNSINDLKFEMVGRFSTEDLRFTKIETDLGAVKTDVADIKSNFNTVRNDVEELKYQG